MRTIQLRKAKNKAKLSQPELAVGRALQDKRETSLHAYAEAAYYAQLNVLSKLELRKTFPGGWVVMNGLELWLSLAIQYLQLRDNKQ